MHDADAPPELRRVYKPENSRRQVPGGYEFCFAAGTDRMKGELVPATAEDIDALAVLFSKGTGRELPEVEER